jgi:hypothetical protein
LNLFSLLVSSSSSSVDASSFGCVVILSLYLTLNFVISSLNVGTCKSACMTCYINIYIYIYIYIYTMEHLLFLGRLYFAISVILTV